MSISMQVKTFAGTVFTALAVQYRLDKTTLTPGPHNVTYQYGEGENYIVSLIINA